MASTETAPHCYRHPKRETWVTCTRCGKPICPDCMVEASVGFQCPDCVAQGRKQSRSGTTAFGATARRDDTLVTKILIGINVAVWVVTVLAAIASGEIRGSEITKFIVQGGVTDLVANFAATPVELFSNGINIVQRGGIADGELYRLVSAGFFHYGILHLALNMYALWILGRVCEGHLGRWRFLALYLIAGIGGATAEFLFDSPGTYAAGASGSIFGLMAALVLMARKLNLELRAITALLLLNLGLGFMIPSVSITGHLGGLITGAAIGAAYVASANVDRKYRTPVQVGALIVVGLILAGLTAYQIADYQPLQ